MAFTVKVNFLDVFKIGDNINYNLKILGVLYQQYAKPEGDKTLLIKPIVIINTSIIEAILYDFIENRMRRPFKDEPLRYLIPEILEALQEKKLDKFEHYIQQAKKYDFFDLKDTNFYEAMDSLRKKRNRIHIQNSKWDEPHNEIQVFDEKVKVLSEKILEKVLSTMTRKYQRQEAYGGYVSDFELPWDKHFTS